MQVRKNQVRLRKGGKCKYGKSKYDSGGMKNASTNIADKVEHKFSPIL